MDMKHNWDKIFFEMYFYIKHKSGNSIVECSGNNNKTNCIKDCRNAPRRPWRRAVGEGAKKRRITGLFTLRRSSGSASATARSFRYAPFPRRCSGTVCRPWSLLRKALIRAAKPS
jgi:hypothetical protein